VDRIDRQIVHCLQRDGRASFRRIAEVLAVSEQTIARRYRTLYGGGAVRVMVLPDPRAGGGQTWFARLQCRPDSTEALATAMAARDDVSWVSLTSGGSEVVCVVRTSPSDARRSALMDRLPRSSQVLSFAACSVLHMHVGGEAEWLAFDDPLTDDQLALLQADSHAAQQVALPALRADDVPLLTELGRDGRSSIAALARATGWPPARVSARLDELLSGAAAHIETDLAPEQFGFHATAYIWLTVAPGDLHEIGEALSRHPETSFAAAVTGASNLMTAVTCRDAEALYKYVTTKVGALPAVRQAEVVPVLRRIKQAGTHMKDGRLVVG
jgi:DNA-binding Lrp family transcriptional regulator